MVESLLRVCFIELSIGIRARSLETILPPRENILKAFYIEAQVKNSPSWHPSKFPLYWEKGIPP
ncbi:hypothetical protein EPI10_024016 [Gossypium australe]|uniref:Uncharacterized protein n=1 Tax=Gossypium australe TaxID=47621 RepID=A0A5B6VXF0_9ROSI|nr:hypothetical protein EPI10_024016 [Gossypium australe]